MKSARPSPEVVAIIADALELSNSEWAEIFGEMATVVDRSNAVYGDSFRLSAQFINILWPDGVPPESYADMLALIRIFDKMKRIATARDAFGESPARDIGGYAALLYREHIAQDRAKER